MEEKDQIKEVQEQQVEEQEQVEQVQEQQEEVQEQQEETQEVQQKEESPKQKEIQEVEQPQEEISTQETEQKLQETSLNEQPEQSEPQPQPQEIKSEPQPQQEIKSEPQTQPQQEIKSEPRSRPQPIEIPQQEQNLQQQFPNQQFFNQQNIHQYQDQQQQHQQQQPVQQQKHHFAGGVHQNLKETVKQRKHECFEQLREWDSKRAEFLQIHGKISNLILGQVDQRLQVSNYFLQMVINFFDHKAKQETAYANYPMPLFEENITQPPVLSQIMGKHNTQLFKLQQKHIERVQKQAEFAQFIWEELLNKSLVAHQGETKHMTDELFHIMNVLQKQLNTNHHLATKKSQKIAKIYQTQQHEKSSIIPTTKHKDIYKSLLGFLRVAEAQKDNSRCLSKHILRYFQKTKELEVKRQGIIQDVIQKYQEAYQKCYGKFADDLDVLNIEDSQKTIEEVYALPTLLGEEYTKFLTEEIQIPDDKKEENEEGLTFRKLQIFLEDFKIQPFEERILVLKSMQIQREANSNVFNDTIMHISVDGFIHCFDIKEDVESKKKYERSSSKIRVHKPVVKKLSSVCVEIKNKENIFAKVFDAGNRITLKFNSSEEIEEFERLIANF